MPAHKADMDEKPADPPLGFLSLEVAVYSHVSVTLSEFPGVRKMFKVLCRNLGRPGKPPRTAVKPV